MKTNHVKKRHGRQIATAWWESLPPQDKDELTREFIDNKTSYKTLNEKQVLDLYKQFK